jgi:hypothetical protein
VPSLPSDVVARTREKYIEAFRRLTGRELDSPESFGGAESPTKSTRGPNGKR